jgi:hypothetical protein
MISTPEAWMRIQSAAILFTVDEAALNELENLHDERVPNENINGRCSCKRLLEFQAMQQKSWRKSNNKAGWKLGEV